MAATDKVTSIDQLTKDERAIVAAALELKSSSVSRAAKAEKNAAVAELRQREILAINALIARFS